MEAIRTVVSDPNPTTTEPEDAAWYEEVQAREDQKRQRKREMEILQGPLAGNCRRYQLQVRRRAKHRPDIVAAMANTVAITILPGDRKTDFDDLLGSRMINNRTVQKVPFANIKFPRLVVAYRFPEGSDPYSGIAVVGYKLGVDRDGKVRYGGPGKAEFAKNAAIKPHPKARAAAIDPERDAVLFDTTLTLDWAMEAAATGHFETVDAFTPPPVVLGFPLSYDIRPESTRAMHTRLSQAFALDGPPFSAFVARQGGQVLSISDRPGGFRNVNLEAMGNLVQYRIPRWAVLQPAVTKGAGLEPGALLADVPRFPHPSVGTIKTAVGDLEWVLRRLLEEATETVVVDDKIYNKHSQGLVVEPRTWKCVPAELVPAQVGRAVGKYLDMRNWLGRKLPDPNDPARSQMITSPADAKVQVLHLNGMPTRNKGLWHEDPIGNWLMDLAWLKPEFAWLQRQREGI